MYYQEGPRSPAIREANSSSDIPLAPSHITSKRREMASTRALHVEHTKTFAAADPLAACTPSLSSSAPHRPLGWLSPSTSPPSLSPSTPPPSPTALAAAVSSAPGGAAIAVAAGHSITRGALVRAAHRHRNSLKLSRSDLLPATPPLPWSSSSCQGG